MFERPTDRARRLHPKDDKEYLKLVQAYQAGRCGAFYGHMTFYYDPYCCGLFEICGFSYGTPKNVAAFVEELLAEGLVYKGAIHCTLNTAQRNTHEAALLESGWVEVATWKNGLYGDTLKMYMYKVTKDK